jgi:hypothetical protein
VPHAEIEMEFQRGITERQRVRLVLADLARANKDYELARQQHSEKTQVEAVEKMTKARATVIGLQSEARRIVEAAGYYKDRERLAALLKVQWTWLLTLVWPACVGASNVGF